MTEGTEAQPNGQETAPPPDTQDKANGEDKKDLFVTDFSDPDANAARISQLYGRTKFLERAFKETTDLNKSLIERLDKIEEKTETKSIGERQAVLRAARVKAFEAGDYNAVNRIDAELFALPAKPEKPPDKTEEKSDELTPEDMAAYNNWALATGEDGQMLRPWAHEGHPDHQKATEIVNGILASPRIEELSPEKRLAATLKELDRLMAPKKAKKAEAAAVLSSDASPRAGRTAGLNEEQKYVARNMYPDMPEDKAYERYMGAWKTYGKQK